MILERTGLCSFEHIFKLSEDRIIKAHIVQHERIIRACNEASKKHKRDIHKIVKVNDYKGFSLYVNSNVTHVMKILANISQSYYPETLSVTYAINLPWLAVVAWNLLKYLLDVTTREKFKIMSSDWQETVVTNIGAEYLPIEYGGTNTNLVVPTPGYLTGRPFTESASGDTPPE